MPDQPVPTKNPVEAAMTVFDHGLAAQERALLNMGVPVDFLARILAQHAASIISLASPASVRAEYMRALIQNFPTQVRKAQLAAATTPGGILLPGKRVDALTEADAPAS